MHGFLLLCGLDHCLQASCDRGMLSQEVHVQACLRFSSQGLSHASVNHRRALLAGKAQPSACVEFSVTVQSVFLPVQQIVYKRAGKGGSLCLAAPTLWEGVNVQLLQWKCASSSKFSRPKLLTLLLLWCHPQSVQSQQSCTPLSKGNLSSTAFTWVCSAWKSRGQL